MNQLTEVCPKCDNIQFWNFDSADKDVCKECETEFISSEIATSYHFDWNKLHQKRGF